MSVVDEVRKGIQDLVTPDMRAIMIRLDVVEKQIAELVLQRLSRIEEQQKRLQK